MTELEAARKRWLGKRAYLVPPYGPGDGEFMVVERVYDAASLGLAHDINLVGCFPDGCQWDQCGGAEEFFRRRPQKGAAG